MVANQFNFGFNSTRNISFRRLSLLSIFTWKYVASIFTIEPLGEPNRQPTSQVDCLTLEELVIFDQHIYKLLIEVFDTVRVISFGCNEIHNGNQGPNIRFERRFSGVKEFIGDMCPRGLSMTRFLEIFRWSYLGCYRTTPNAGCYSISPGRCNAV